MSLVVNAQHKLIARNVTSLSVNLACAAMYACIASRKAGMRACEWESPIRPCLEKRKEKKKEKRRKWKKRRKEETKEKRKKRKKNYSKKSGI